MRRPPRPPRLDVPRRAARTPARRGCPASRRCRRPLVLALPCPRPLALAGGAGGRRNGMGLDAGIRAREDQGLVVVLHPADAIGRCPVGVRELDDLALPTAFAERPGLD